MSHIVRFSIFAFCLAFVLALSQKKPFPTSLPNFKLQDPPNTHGESTLIQFSQLLHNQEASAHASALLRKDSTLLALFYAGSREGADDVKIYKSHLDLATPIESRTWSRPQILLTPEALSRLSGRFIRKLGNPSLVLDSNKRAHLFVVGVSLGGWATSRIYQFYFDENLENIHYVGELKLSPFGNYSHLVRTHGLAFEGGGFLLPFSHEMWHKFPLVGYFDLEGKLVGIKRLNDLKAQLQPSLAAIDSKQCVAFFRANNRYNDEAYFQECDLGGASWSGVLTSNLHNYDSSVLLVSLGKEVVLIQNDGKTNPNLGAPDKNRNDRLSLSLYWLADRQKAHFEYLTTIDRVESGEVSYPSAALDSDYLHLAYTYNRQTIKHASLSIQAILRLIESKKSGG